MTNKLICYVDLYYYYYWLLKQAFLFDNVIFQKSFYNKLWSGAKMQIHQYAYSKKKFF